MRKSVLIPLLLLALPALAASGEYVTWTALAKLFAAISLIQILPTLISSFITGDFMAFIGTLIGGLIGAAIIYYLVLFLKNVVS